MHGRLGAQQQAAHLIVGKRERDAQDVTFELDELLAFDRAEPGANRDAVTDAQHRPRVDEFFDAWLRMGRLQHRGHRLECGLESFD